MNDSGDFSGAIGTAVGVSLIVFMAAAVVCFGVMAWVLWRDR